MMQMMILLMLMTAFGLGVSSGPDFIEKRPEMYLKAFGDNIELDCRIDRPSTILRVDWMKDERLISWYQRVPAPEFSDDNQVMMLRDVKTPDAGRYTCLVKNVYQAHDLSRVFDVKPTAAPVIEKSVRDIHAFVGDVVKFRCFVSRYFTEEYKWYFQGKELTGSGRDGRLRIRSSSFLKIQRAELSDSGVYTCSVSNLVGTTVANFTLTVLKPTAGVNMTSPPDREPVLYHPDVDEVFDVVENTITLSCQAFGAKPINVTWLKDGSPIESKPRVQSKKYVLSPNKQELSLPKLHLTDQGMFSCILENEYGRLVHNISVNPQEAVRTKPRFMGVQSVRPVYRATLGSTLHVVSEKIFTARSMHAQLLKHVNLSVAKSGLEVLYTPRQFVTVDDTDQAAGDILYINFTFANIAKSDFANYTIMIGNSIGYDVWYFNIEEETLASPIKGKKFRPAGVGITSKSKVLLPVLVTVGIAVVLLVATFLVLYRVRRAKACRRSPSLSYPGSDTGMTSLGDSSFRRRMRYSDGRLASASQAMKEYVSYLVPPDPSWDVPYENIVFEEMLGEGAFGQVMKATVHGLPGCPGPKTVAVKRLKDNASDQELSDLISEMQVMKIMGTHKNIINLVGVSTQQEVCVLVEFCLFGNLRQFLRDRRPTIATNPSADVPLTLFDLTSYCWQVAKGMDYLSSQKCIHRDLAARNVLVDEQRTMKIADFGLARNVHQNDYYRKCTDGRLPVKWMAMEALFDRVYTTQSDVWSFGILCWEVVTFGGSPYPGIPFERLFDLLKEGYRMEKPINCTDAMYGMMLDCWKELPTQRPSFSQVVDRLEKMLEEFGENPYLDIQLEAPIVSPLPETGNISPPCSRRSSSASMFRDDENHNEPDLDNGSVFESEKGSLLEKPLESTFS